MQPNPAQIASCLISFSFVVAIALSSNSQELSPQELEAQDYQAAFLARTLAGRADVEAGLNADRSTDRQSERMADAFEDLATALEVGGTKDEIRDAYNQAVLLLANWSAQTASSEPDSPELLMESEVLRELGEYVEARLRR